ncbi:MAG: phosphate ABC transporter substrate-binding protein [Bdellovibrionaceae bacterium]|nr:phosphate ABC transporter substrate-binding protein [Pseudobdellovibrionaceae bacterium]
MKKVLWVCAGLVALAGCGQKTQKLVIKGSDTLGAKLVPQIAEAYRAQNPGTIFEIAAEGSTTGIAAVIDGTADIGMSSRHAKSTEISQGAAKGVKMTETIACYDGIAVVVNEANPIAVLTLAQVEQIFTGDLRDWEAFGGAPGPISVYTRNTSSGTYSDFKELTMNKRDYGNNSQKMAGNEQIAAEVGRNPNGVGYIGLAYIHAEGIKVLAIDGEMPTAESIRSRKYHIARPTFYYTNGEPTGRVKQFIDFALGPAGAQIAERIGFVPAQ